MEYSTGARIDKLDERDWQLADREAFDVINAARGNPDAEITIYRAMPAGSPTEINAGDWVTTSKTYAKIHGDSWEDSVIVSAKVRAGDLFTEGSLVHEFGWSPEPKASMSASEAPKPKEAY